MVLGGFKPFPFGPEDREVYAQRVKYFQATRRVLAARNGVYVDVGRVLWSKAKRLAALWDGHTVYSDGTHFNAVGAEIIATQVLNALGVLTLETL